jgi:IS5 family transposase
MQVEGVLTDVDTQKRYGVHERSSYGQERNPVSLDSPGFSNRADHLIKVISISLV